MVGPPVRRSRFEKMAGEPAAMEHEAAFFKALENTRNYEFDQGKLVFGDLGNNTMMVLKSK